MVGPGERSAASVLGVDHHVATVLWLATAEEDLTIVRLTRVTGRIFDFAGDQCLLASSAVTHAATKVEIEIILFSEFKETLLISGPIGF